MPFSAIATALGTSLATVIGTKALEEGVETALSPLVNEATDRLEKKLKLGKYEEVHKALERAKLDVLAAIPATREFAQSLTSPGQALNLPTYLGTKVGR